MPATVTPEQLPPEPITQPAAPVPAGVRVRRPATRTEVLLSVVPGLGHLVRGEWVPGMLLLLAWGFTLSLAFLTRAKIAAVFTARRLPADGLVAVATLAVTALLLWGWAFRDLAVKSRRQKRLHGDSQWSIAARHFRKNRLAIAGLGVMLLLYLVTLVTPLIAPFDPAE
ncbi:MAG TPA: hypothetical protein VGO40_17805, partial [Longimicrobium sp.]|nr:hypothetical protein [Longimicrobium sp.]